MQGAHGGGKTRVEVRGSPERDISPLHAFGAGGKLVSGVVRSQARAFSVDF